MLEPGEGQSPTPSELGKNPQGREYEETAKTSFREVIKQGTGTLGLPVYKISESASPSDPLRVRNPDALLILRENLNRGDIVEKVALLITEGGVYNLNPINSTPEYFNRFRHELRKTLYDMAEGKSGSKPPIELPDNERLIITDENGDKTECYIGSQVEDEMEIANTLKESRDIINTTREELAKGNNSDVSRSEQKAIHAANVHKIALGLLGAKPNSPPLTPLP